jgi:membrane protein YqaA with SNARE-associated domain
MPTTMESRPVPPIGTNPADDGGAASPAARSRNPIRRLYDWVLHWAETPYGTPALFVISFAESSFFPIPPDVLQVALSVARPKRAFYYAAVSAVASVLGGIAGWAIGYALWSIVADFFFSYVPGFSRENVAFVQTKYEENAFLAILAAAFTPIPYKVFTIAAGVFHIGLPTLIAASALGRSGRFFAVAACIYWCGPKVKHLLEKYFEIATLAFFALLVGGFLLVKYALR